MPTQRVWNLRRNDSGVAALIGALVSAAVVALAFSAVILGAHRDLGEVAAEEREVDLEASAVLLAEQLMGDRGTGWYEAPCIVGDEPSTASMSPDLVTRAGLAREKDEDCPAIPPRQGLELSFAKLQNLRAADVQATANDRELDYAEARSSLAFTSHDFHLSIRVTVADVAATLQHGFKNDHLRVLYIGDYANPPGPDPMDPTDAAKGEAAFLDALVRTFDQNVRVGGDFDHPDLPYAGNGDILPDDGATIADVLGDLLTTNDGNENCQDDPGSLAAYNTLLIGSNVDHDEFAGACAKFRIEAFVRAGGTMIVLGSDSAAYTWMQPLFHVMRKESDGTLEIEQPDHTLLNTPNALTAADFDDDVDNDGKADGWELQAGSVDDFASIVENGNPTLLVSNEDDPDLGDGRVILTSWRPWDPDGDGMPEDCAPTGLGPTCPGLSLVQNLITIGLERLDIEYGPSIPTDGPVAAVNRLGMVYHPRLGNHVELTALVYVF